MSKDNSFLINQLKDKRKTLVSKIDARPFVSVNDLEFYRDTTNSDLKYKIYDLVSRVASDSKNK
mgnify:CR=1 FL=1